MNRRQWKKLGKKILVRLADVRLPPKAPRNFLRRPTLRTEATSRFWALSQKQASRAGCTEAEQRELAVLMEMVGP